MINIIHKSRTIFFSFLLSFFSLNSGYAQSCDPDELAKKLSNHLKSKIYWVDLNVDPINMNLSIRYYPCFSNSRPLEELVVETLKELPQCQLFHFGEHLTVEDYCVLKDLKFYSISD